jgi:hypothetical protein
MQNIFVVFFCILCIKTTMQNIRLCRKIISLSSTVTSCNSHIRHIREGICMIVGYMA